MLHSFFKTSSLSAFHKETETVPSLLVDTERLTVPRDPSLLSKLHLLSEPLSSLCCLSYKHRPPPLLPCTPHPWLKGLPMYFPSHSTLRVTCSKRETQRRAVGRFEVVMTVWAVEPRTSTGAFRIPRAGPWLPDSGVYSAATRDAALDLFSFQNTGYLTSTEATYGGRHVDYSGLCWRNWSRGSTAPASDKGSAGKLAKGEAVVGSRGTGRRAIVAVILSVSQAGTPFCG